MSRPSDAGQAKPDLGFLKDGKKGYKAPMRLAVESNSRKPRDFGVSAKDEDGTADRYHDDSLSAIGRTSKLVLVKTEAE